MRRILLFFVFIMLGLSASAQTIVGFTNETSSRDNNFRLSTNTDQRLAVRFGAEKLQLMKGSTIKAIRLAVGSKQSTGNTATLYLTTALGAEPVTTEQITLSSTNKFVEYALTTPYTITGEEDALFVGCQMTIGASYGPFSADGSRDMKNTAFAYGKKGWEDLYGKGYGMPNIEIVLAENVEMPDVVVLKSFEEDGYMKAGTPFTRTFEMQNFGTNTISSFNVNATIDNELRVFSFDNLNIAPRKTYQFTLADLLASKTGMQQMTLNIGDAECSTDVYFYPQDMEKNVLVELFTGQTCTNCPSGHSSMTTALERSGVKAVEIAHHSGFVTDIFSMKEDWNLTSLYNGSTYAPAAMVNRVTYGEGQTPVFDPQSVSATTSILSEADTQKPYVSLAMDTDYDEATRMVTLKARVYPHEEMPGEDIRYSIWLTQDSLIAAQSGASQEYVHNAVSRGCITEGTWGENLNCTPGQEVVITKTFELPDEIVSTSYTKTDSKNHIATVLKDMKLVMLVHQQSSNNVNACRVFNAAEVAIGESMRQGGFPLESERKMIRQTFYGDNQGYEKEDVATRTLDYLYDSENRLVRVIETSKDTNLDSWQLTHYKKYDYDTAGKLTMEYSLQYGQFDYGDMGFRASSDTICYEYNDKGQLAKEVHPLHYYEYTFDEQGRMLTRSTWKINSITRYASNDLLETFSDFNSFGKPEKMIATSPAGKSWNEYTATMVYDAEGNLVSEVHVDEDGVRKYAEYWTYENGVLTVHELPTIYDDGTEVQNEKEVFTAVEGDSNSIRREVLLYNGNGTWSKMAGSIRVDDYGMLTKGDAPKISFTLSEDNINTAIISVDSAEGEGYVYRNGIRLPRNEWRQYTDFEVTNGTYEYMAVLDGKASDIITHTYNVALPAVKNLHGASVRKDFFGSQFVTLAWENPQYDSCLGFIRNDIFLENMQQPELSTDNATATNIDMEYGEDTVRRIFVQTVYKFGRANSEVVTIDADEVVDGIDLYPTLSDKERAMYNLQGQRVYNAGKGVYIMNGRKTVIAK